MGATPDQLVAVSDLEVTVGERQLIDRVSFDLRAGELLTIVGRNGAGKSTLLRHISGELKARGNITVFGESPQAHDPRALARRRAVLTQNTHLNFACDVEEVVLLGRIPHQKRQVETDADREVALLSLERVGLAHLAGRNYLTLSGGEQQRVHLARVLAQLHGTEGNRLLLLDEPTSSLDISYQHEVLRLARGLGREGVGVLAVLHDLNLASQYADRVLMLAGRRVLAYGTPREVLTPATVREAFGHDVLIFEHPTLGFPLILSAS